MWLNYKIPFFFCHLQLLDMLHLPMHQWSIFSWLYYFSFFSVIVRQLHVCCYVWLNKGHAPSSGFLIEFKTKRKKKSQSLTHDKFDVKYISNNSYIWTAVVDQSEEWSSQ